MAGDSDSCPHSRGLYETLHEIKLLYRTELFVPTVSPGPHAWEQPGSTWTAGNELHSLIPPQAALSELGLLGTAELGDKFRISSKEGPSSSRGISASNMRWSRASTVLYPGGQKKNAL